MKWNGGGMAELGVYSEARNGGSLDRCMEDLVDFLVASLVGAYQGG